MTAQKPGFDPATYQTARSSRPAWATTLILALVTFLVAVAGFILGTPQLGWIAALATVVCLVIAGIQALARVKR